MHVLHTYYRIEIDMTFAYFHAAPAGTPSQLYLSKTSNRGRKVLKNLAPMTGSQKGTGPDWSRLDTSKNYVFGKDHDGN